MFTLKKFSVLFAFALSSLCPQIGKSWSSTPPPIVATLSCPKRNNVFYLGEQPKFNVTPEAVRYEVRDYYGNLVDQGNIAASTSSVSFGVNVAQAGWYKLYLYGSKDQGKPWGTSVAGTTFVIFRNNPNFPALPPAGTTGSSRISDDEIMREVTAMGPQRIYVDDANDPNTAIAQISAEIAIDKAMHSPLDPVRARPFLISFPNGTSGKLEGVKQIVQYFQNDVQYWEGRNEPNGAYTGAAFALFEEKQFFQTVKSVSSNLQVLGPAVVCINPGMIAWISEFLKYGGGNYIDGFSFHAYNCVNGDWWLLRTSLANLNSLLASYNLSKLPLWQTEQGYMAAVYGSYQPRLQGRWTMLQMMGYEQYGIPKEHNHLWYDVSHGFWDAPMWWENGDGSLNPAAALMRVWSEELFGLQYTKALDFGTVDNELYIGDLFTNGTRSMAALMTAGNPYGSVKMSVNSGDHIHVVNPFGNESDVKVTNGTVTLPISELPTYIEFLPGQTCTIAPRTYGNNLSVSPGVSVTASGSKSSPLGANIPNDPSKIVNGLQENWYWSQGDSARPWMSNVTQWPATVEIALPSLAAVSDIIIQAAVPWQSDGTLVDYELQYWNGTGWATIEHVTEPTKTIPVYSQNNWCSIDSFFSDRCVFEHHFAAVTTSRIRLVVNDVTYGGGATADVVAAGGQTGPHQITLREVSIFQQPTAAPVIVVQPVNTVVQAGSPATLSVVTSTGENAEYVWQKSGVVVQDSTASTLTIPSTTPDAEGSYQVLITNAGGTAISHPALLLLDTPVNNWIVKYFPQTPFSDIGTLLASDSNGDGLPNLSKYYFGMVPGTQVKRQNLPVTSVGQVNGVPFLTLSYVFNPAATDVQAVVEGCKNLRSAVWGSVQPDSLQIVPTGASDNSQRATLTFLITANTPSFFRLNLHLTTATTASGTSGNQPGSSKRRKNAWSNHPLGSH